MNLHNKEQLIIDNMPLVKYLASKYYTNKLGMEYEDLVSYGTMGLIDATNKFDISKGVKFSTFASLKIKAYIIDEIRRVLPISRGDMSKIKIYNSAVESLQNTFLREPTDEEIAKQMGVSIKEVSKIETQIGLLSTTSLDSVIFEENDDVTLKDTISEKESLTPSSIIEEEEKLEVLAKAIDMLKEKDKLVLSLYYYEELTLKEIGNILGVSESRVSQLHSRAIVNLRNIMSKLDYIA